MEIFTLRSYLWRLYCPVLTAALKEEISTEQPPPGNAENVLDEVAKLTQIRPVLGLISSSTTSVGYDEARTMLAAVVRIASRLGAWGSYPFPLDLDIVRKRNLTFNATSPLLEAHAIHNINRDKGNYNGQRIAAVTRPGLIALSGEHWVGQELEKGRILALAIVLLDEHR